VGCWFTRMKHLQPVIWAKGTFLTPQHLQIQDRFIEDGLRFRFQTVKYCCWGFRELAIDQERLAAGEIAVSRAAGIFPDGLLFEVPDSDPAPPSRALADCFEAHAASTDIYLTVPDLRDGGVNVAARRDTNSRYIAEVMTLRDENTGLNEKPVQVGRKNFRLLVEGENREGTASLRIARIERRETGVYRLDPNFVPPLLDVRANGYLLGIMRGLVEILSAKSTQLSGARRQRNQSLADFTASDIANFWLLYTVNSYFPIFNFLFEAKTAHPEELYSAMLELAGTLTTFSSKIRGRDLPRYDHDELSPCFALLDEKLRSLLETVVPTNFVALPLRLTQPSIYGTVLDDERYLKNSRMYLAVAAMTSEEDVIRRVPQLLKVCSATHIEHLVKQALPGVELTHLTNPPSAIPVKLKYQYFSLNQSGAAWEAIRRARNFAAFVPGELPNPEMELLILLPSTD
jgi:type VI secretion system protein ImpJ